MVGDPPIELPDVVTLAIPAFVGLIIVEMIAVRLTYLQPKDGFKWSNPPENNYVDKHVFAKLKMLNILPSDLCSDQEFARRVYMDVCGVLPTAAEAKAFLDSKEPNKRAKLIDTLLNRPEYADLWALKWADVLRSNRKTRAASISALQVRVWPDATGRITRAQLVGSTGQRELDATLQNEVLTGLQLQAPPPAGMPAPIVLRLNLRRP